MAKTPQQYWNERQKQLWANLETSERSLQTKLSKYYVDEAKVLEKEIGAYFSKYGKDNVIEYRNLLQQLSKADKDLLYRDCERFAEKYPQHADLMPVRTSIYKLDRLQGLELSIKMQQLEIGAIEEAELTKHLTTVFKKAIKKPLKQLVSKLTKYPQNCLLTMIGLVKAILVRAFGLTKTNLSTI